MARTKKDKADYFPHEANATSGDTLTILQGKYGNDGYAFWFKLLEKLTATEGHYLDLRNTAKWELFTVKMGVTAEISAEIMDLLVELDAIDEELWQRKMVWCQNLVDNLSEVYKNRRRELPQKPIITDKKPISTGKKGIITPEIPQSRVEESRVKYKENNKRKYGEFHNVLLTDEEKQKLQDRFNKQTAVLIERLSTYLESTGKRYKSHYATILSWVQRDEKEAKSGKAKHSRDLPKTYTEPPDYPDD